MAQKSFCKTTNFTNFTNSFLSYSLSLHSHDAA